MDDTDYVDRLTSIMDHKLSLRSRDNFGALCDHCGWSILTRPELDFPDSTDKTISDSDPVICSCEKNIDCEFCGNQLQWAIEDSSSEKKFENARKNGWPMGVDWTECRDGKLAYTVCRNLHPQGPLPRPTHTVKIWFDTIQSETRKQDPSSVTIDAEYFNRVMSCFEVYYQVGLSIAIVEVGIFLAWDLVSYDFNTSARMVLDMAESNLKNCTEEKNTIGGLEIRILGAIANHKISQENDDVKNISDFVTEFEEIVNEYNEISDSGLNPGGAPLFLQSLMDLVTE